MLVLPGTSIRRTAWRAAPLTASSMRVLLAGTIGVVIWIIWATGTFGDSQRVTMLALSSVSILGLGLVIELRRRFLAEEAVSEQESRYRFLSDHSFDMIVRFNPRTQRRTYVSPAVRHLYGYEPAEAVALPAEAIIHPDDLPRVREALTELQLNSAHAPIMYRGRRKDGTYIWVEASLTLLQDPETGAPEIVSIVRDIAERVRYEDALRQAKEDADTANQAKSRFLATMSHELRTPLNAIIGFAEIIQKQVMGPLGNTQYQSYIDDIHASGEHLLHLINDILDLTKAEAGRLELHEDTFDIEEIVRSVARLNAAAAKNAALTIAVDMAQGMRPLRADERKTRQVLFNLIGNAIKFTPAGGRITIAGRFDPGVGTVLTVTDTGIGIDERDLARVFEPFVQVDSSLGRQHDGTGLGLPTAKALMELHGGTLELQSKSGAGTTATIVFPPDRAEPRDAAAAAGVKALPVDPILE